MIKIRQNAFETNSSSTHCLVINNETTKETSEDVFTKQYIIHPFTSPIYGAEYTTVEDKLKYFLTLYYMGDDYHTSIMDMLSEMFPNAIFVKEFGKDYSSYVYEDGNYYQEDFRPTYEELKDFMLNGTVYFGDRDGEQFADKVDDLKYSPHRFFCAWSG